MIRSKSMTNAKTFGDIREMVSSGLPKDSFGPNSDNPYLAFNLTGSDEYVASWISGLPCPVIGIGTGAAEQACDVILPDDSKLDLLDKNIRRAPIAAMVLVQHLRASETLSMADALLAESLAYSAVQKGPEFETWLTTYKGGSLNEETGPSIIADVTGNDLNIRLNRPKNYNAIGTEMRDALCEILDMAILNPNIETISLTGSGKTFSIGGAIQEFGEVTDPATAHWIRSLRLPATRFAQLKEKLSFYINGAAIGAGTEIAAFGKHVTASPKAWFQLPELKYGLIPGAGGTVSLPRRIGRQRTAYMALTMEKFSAQKAEDWGLVDQII